MGGDAPVPDFRDKKLGMMRRVAAWLATEVGEGNTFTKQQLSEAFPDGGEVARRLRELRHYQWELDVSRGITAEWRLLKIGLPVWDPKIMGRGPSRLLRTTTLVRETSEAREALARANRRCSICGIRAGDSYPDLPEANAKLLVRHVVPLSGGGVVDPDNLLVVCSRCDEPEVDHLMEMVSQLSPLEKTVFASWMAVGERSLSPLDRLWALYMRLKPQERDQLARAVATAAHQELLESMISNE
jgi:hypothetical protein